MSNQTENNSGPGGLAYSLPPGRENPAPIATGAASSSRRNTRGAIIYKVTNLVNGKIYIGKTVQKLLIRKTRHMRSVTNGSNYCFHCAIRKYGIENFKWEIVDQCLLGEFTVELEKFYIKKYNCKVPLGYNMTDGGEGQYGRYPSEETRAKIGASSRGRKWSLESRAKKGIFMKGNKYLLGHRHSVESRAKMSRSRIGNKNALGSNGPLGYKHSMETRERMSKSQIERYKKSRAKVL